MELLAPAGGPAAFWAALAGGADAIYCGLGSDFNARRGADNFGDEEFRAACRAAHLAGVRVYVTENVVIKQEEMPAALALVRRAWLLGADAFIVQDWGLMAEVLRLWPEVEVHVSTQANVHDPRGVAWCRSLGARRVTLSRELSIPEIGAIAAQEHAAKDGCELEVFGHGALCVCYSGVCLLSSMRALTERVRSANRGLCAQPCRLPYELVDERGRVIAAPGRTRPLCPKDSCSANDLPALEAAGADSIKLEGRMKAPDYVWSVTSAYREALDELAAGEPIDPAIASERLKRTFNRNLTDAYLHGRSGDEMMSYERSNNRGIVVGEVTATRRLYPARESRGGSSGGRVRGKVLTPAETTIRLVDDVFEGDLLEIRPPDDPDAFLTAPVRADARAGESIDVRTARPMAAGSTVRLIRTQSALDAAVSIAGKAEAGGCVRPRPVDVRVTCRLGSPLRVELSCDSHVAAAEGPVVEAARTRAVTEGDLAEHVGRMGASPFCVRSMEVRLDEGCGIGFSVVHKVRAEACAALERALLAPWDERTLAEPTASVPEGPDGATGVACAAASDVEPTICALAATPSAAEAALAAGAGRVYATAEALGSLDGWPEGVVCVLPEVCRADGQAAADAWVRPGEPVAVGNVSELALAAERHAAPEVRGLIPVHNTYALGALERAGAACVWLSPELTLKEAARLARDAAVPLGSVVYGRVRAMTCEHCVLQASGRCEGDCASCELRRQRTFLRDERGDDYPIVTDAFGRTRVYTAQVVDAIPEAAQLAAAGVRLLMVDGTLLSDAEFVHEVVRLKAALASAKAGEAAPRRERGATSGHLRHGIE